MSCQEDRFLRMAIEELKQKRHAVILAHYYQNAEIQDIADYVGDSLQLARQAAQVKAKMIVFCGVYFMAESAKILSPEKIVLLPQKNAGCGLADMALPDAVKARRNELPSCQVVTYVNSSAAVKAESDICCTSANAVKVVASLPQERPVLFVPDRNLGSYVAKQTGRKLHFWEGYCPIHDQVTLEEVKEARARHPEAALIVHPECRPEITEIADCVASTGGMMKYVAGASASSFLIGTETGMLHALRKAYPHKAFYPVTERMVCSDMKLIALEDVKNALEKIEFQVNVPEATRLRAAQALSRMLEVS